MIPDAVEVRLSRKDRAGLEARLRTATTPQRDVFRARIVLLAAQKRSTRSIAREVQTMPRTVSLLARSVCPRRFGWAGRTAPLWPQVEVWRGRGAPHSRGLGHPTA